MEKLKELINRLNEMGIFDEVICDESAVVECFCPDCDEAYDEEFEGLVEVDAIEKGQSLQLKLLLQDIQTEIDGHTDN